MRNYSGFNPNLTMPEQEESKPKYIPSLSQLKAVASKLPPPEDVAESSRAVSFGNSETHTLDFEKVVVKKSDGTKAVRWIYFRSSWIL